MSQTEAQKHRQYSLLSPCLFILEVNCPVINSECKKTGYVSSMCYGGYQPDRIPEKTWREAHGSLLDLIFTYSITMGGFFSVVLAAK